MPSIGHFQPLKAKAGDRPGTWTQKDTAGSSGGVQDPERGRAWRRVLTGAARTPGNIPGPGRTQPSYYSGPEHTLRSNAPRGATYGSPCALLGLCSCPRQSPQQGGGPPAWKWPHPGRPPALGKVSRAAPGMSVFQRLKNQFQDAVLDIGPRFSSHDTRTPEHGGGGDGGPGKASQREDVQVGWVGEAGWGPAPWRGGRCRASPGQGLSLSCEWTGHAAKGWAREQGGTEGLSMALAERGKASQSVEGEPGSHVQQGQKEVSPPPYPFAGKPGRLSNSLMPKLGWKADLHQPCRTAAPPDGAKSPPHMHWRRATSLGQIHVQKEEAFLVMAWRREQLRCPG